MERGRFKYKIEIRIISRYNDELFFRKAYFKNYDDMIKCKKNIIHKFYHNTSYHDFSCYRRDWINKVNEQLIIFHVYY